MLKKIKVKEDYICFFKGEKFQLKPITLLVGDQGCGKSTLLRIIKNCAEKTGDYSNFEIEKQEDSAIEKVMYLDLETGNPAIQQPNPNDAQDMLYKLTSRFNSHGETLFPILKHLNTVSNALILLDEPETALSLRSQFKMIEIFKACLERGCQVVLATHNLVFMEAFPDSVLSLEHMKYLTPKKFVKLEKEPNTIKETREDKRIKKVNCRMGISCTCTKETGGWYDRNCIHYVDRSGKSGYAREGRGANAKMKKGDFKNG